MNTEHLAYQRALGVDKAPALPANLSNALTRFKDPVVADIAGQHDAEVEALAAVITSNWAAIHEMKAAMMDKIHGNHALIQELDEYAYGRPFTKEEIALINHLFDECDGRQFTEEEIALRNHLLDEYDGRPFTKEEIALVKHLFDEYDGRQFTEEEIALINHLLDEYDGRPFTEEEIALRNHLLDECERLQKTFIDECGQNRDFYYALHGEVLKSYGEQIRTGRIALVPEVEAHIEGILDGLKMGEIVLLHGDTGSGKTETARVAARRFSEGREPIVVRGYPQMSQEELYGHLALNSNRQSSWVELVKKIDEACNDFDKENPDLSAEERSKKHQLITDIACSEGNFTVSEYILGAHYVAMNEGRVLIIDEANAIHPELRRKANELDTKKPGETVTIQEDGGKSFEVKDGYGKIETANLGKKYGEGGGGRHAYSPDELNRRTKIEIDYLPQETKGNAQDIKDPNDKQLFMIAVASMLDEKGCMVAPEHSLKTLWNLVQFAKVTQLAFAGRISDDTQLFQQGGTSVTIPLDTLISPRTLQRILSRWRKEGFRYEIDHYLKKLVLDQATDPTQRAYLHQLGSNYGFFSSSGWPNQLDYGANGKLSHFDVKSPKNRESGAIQTILLTDIVEAIYGEAPPRSDWPGKSPDALVSEEDRRDHHERSIRVGAIFKSLGLRE